MCREYPSALYDWGSTSDAGLSLSIWVNNSNVGTIQGPPYLQRWNQPINLAINAYLKHLKVGVKLLNNN
jgi:hypothetical protein